MITKIKPPKNNEILKNNTNKLQFNGYSKGNPGLAGSGSVLYKNNVEIWHNSTFLGEKIPNYYAEYMGLIIGLKKAKELDIQNLIIESDNLFVIKEMKGEYEIVATKFLFLYNQAKLLENNFDNIIYNHIYRDYNKRAIELSNNAVKNYLNKQNKI